VAQKYKIAIVGAGPSGYFAAQALQNSATEDLTFSIDMIERLPTPWGLVRSGVAPDHPKIKTVSKVFEKIASEPNFRLFGNVELGKDLSLEDLTSRYDAVVMATGSAIGKKLGIPGEDLANSISAAQFVPWYNGHPDYADFKVDLSGKVAVVVGAGNVAMDCGRILAIDPKELDETDTADHAYQILDKSNIRQVFIKILLDYICYGICNLVFYIHTSSSLAIYFRTCRKRIGFYYDNEIPTFCNAKANSFSIAPFGIVSFNYDLWKSF
jgi:ferredoxin--NADP+ reductase